MSYLHHKSACRARAHNLPYPCPSFETLPCHRVRMVSHIHAYDSQFAVFLFPCWAGKLGCLNFWTYFCYRLT